MAGGQAGQGTGDEECYRDDGLLDRLAAELPEGRAGLSRIWAVLPRARLVGGVVRDLIAGRVVSDLDLATPEAPDRVIAALAGAGIKVVPTGLAHGTVTAVIAGRPYEITTLRRDERTDGRHAVVAWTDDWREDAARRDFTINAMSCGCDGVVHDYFGGRADVRTGHVRFVGDAATRIHEDALRILRFFRFHARYGRGEPDGAAMAAIAALADGLARLSVERVWSELRRILAGPALMETLALMERSGVLARLLPEGTDRPALDRLLATGAPADAILRLGVLAPGDAGGLAARLRLSRAEAVALSSVRAAPVPDPAADDDARRRLLADEPAEILVRRSWVGQAARLGRPSADWDELRQDLTARPRPVFPLAGRDLLAAGIPPGPRVGQALAELRAWWMAGGCRARRQACLARLGEGAADRTAGPAPG
ncbi:CCA tRNA nucleotidyltransferase [Gluconacetobacter tumulisoli]|uniref:CCA tRNA nucleotidyltransferase n=1 Tax=Gluconacetobacter tumulisoli TaxID=1286189 RepID=A0A7W4PL38_9PROT|nr:CCA tRNA nucleotidyltransferase [Gluconacetobacter tumulisoli]MBB2200244.1 CCA tRNA nucleotidyltransferase [Gluconacetobacter tumulisoli]